MVGSIWLLAVLATVWILSKGGVADDIAEERLVLLNIDMSQTTGAGGAMSRAEEVPSVATSSFSRLLGELCANGH